MNNRRWNLTVPPLGLLALLLALGSGPYFTASGADRKTTIKLGTLAPRGTSYHKSLVSLGQQWRQLSSSQLNLVIYPDGQQGSEADMIGLMRTGNLDAALLTAGGLAEIERRVIGLQNLPLMFRSLDEVDYVGNHLQPRLEKLLLEKGFVVLFWADSGWIRFFSKQPLLTPSDLKSMKLFAWAGGNDQIEIMKESGFNPQALETVDIASGLQSGIISAVPMPPFFALANQIDKRAPHMLEINWAPLVGAAVMRQQTWEKLGAHQEACLKAAVAIGEEVQKKGRNENNEAVEAMRKRGLKVASLTPELEAEWGKTIEVIYPKIRGRLVPADIFDEVQRLVAEYRKKQPAS